VAVSFIGKETGVPGDNHRTVASTPRHEQGSNSQL